MFSLRRTDFLEDSSDTMLYQIRPEGLRTVNFMDFCYFYNDSCRKSWTARLHKFEMTPLQIILIESD